MNEAIIGFLSTMLIGGVTMTGKIVWDRIKRAERHADEAKEKAIQVEKNHLEKFEEIKKLQRENHAETIAAISDLHIELAKNYVTKPELEKERENLVWLMERSVTQHAQKQ